MTPEQNDLARRLVASKHFRFVVGMVLTAPNDGRDSIRAVDGDGNPTVYDYNPADGHFLRSGVCASVDDPAPEELAETGDTLPDLESPATIGCLLALVREAWGDPYAYTVPQSVGTGWSCCTRKTTGRGPTEADAIVAALLAAP